jgi:hypothetical protein
MGFIRDGKAAAMGKLAQEAWDQELSFFTPLLVLPFNHIDVETAIPDWAQSLSAVAAVGWKLDHWSVAYTAKGRPHAFPVFIRP